MELLLDTGNVKEIRELFSILAVDGVTTNPTIVSKEKKKFIALINEIDEIVGEDTPIHAQVLSTNFEDIIEEALYISKLRKNMYVKIPVTSSGFRAIKELKKQGIKITAEEPFEFFKGFSLWSLTQVIVVSKLKRFNTYIIENIFMEG